MPPKKTLRSQKNKAVRNRAVKSFTKSRVKNAIDALEDSTPENNQEIAKVYGYVEVGNITDSVTLPLYIDNLLTSS